jgi:hypothetical protein
MRNTKTNSVRLDLAKSPQSKCYVLLCDEVRPTYLRTNKHCIPHMIINTLVKTLVHIIGKYRRGIRFKLFLIKTPSDSIDEK